MNVKIYINVEYVLRFNGTGQSSVKPNIAIFAQVGAPLIYFYIYVNLDVRNFCEQN